MQRKLHKHQLPQNKSIKVQDLLVNHEEQKIFDFSSWF